MKNTRFSALLLLLAVVAFSLTSCTEESSITENGVTNAPLEERRGNTHSTPTNTIVDIAVGDPDNFSTLVTAVVNAGLADALSGGNWTVFAPTNAAFDAFLDAAGFDDINDVPVDVLTTVLKTHVIPGEAFADDLSNGYFKTIANGPDATLTDVYISTDNGVTINGASNVIIPNVDADNGVIHVIDQVIAPSSLVSLAVNNPNFSILVAALTRPDLTVDFVGALSAPGPFTVVAPTNQAFVDLLNVVPEWNGLEDIPRETLETVLLYHVSGQGNFTSGFFFRPSTFMTLQGSSFSASFVPGSGVVIEAGSNAANVIATDVQAQNGVIHAIDAVILP